MTLACASTRSWLLFSVLAFLSGAAGVSSDQADSGPNHRFTATYTRVEHPDLKEIESELRSLKFLEKFADGLNEELKLPASVDLALGQCDQANAFYLPDERRVVVCYELLLQLAADFANAGYSDEQLEIFIGGTATFVLLHELGHALTDVLDLAITGREEDVADQLATVLLIETGMEGETAAAGAAVWFLQTSVDQRLDHLAYADEHSLGPQRYYNILCWIYGQDPERHADLIGPGLLPTERAAACPVEFQRLVKAWEKLLTPYAR